MLKAVFSLFFLVSFISLVSAINQREYQRPLSVVDGLVSNDVNCILQDERGFMWYGTSNGLSRFDGYQFKIYKSNFKSPNFFTSNNIRSLAEDKSGALWIGTINGINKLNLYTGEVVHFSDSPLANISINAIVVSDDNTPYFGTSNGVYYYDRESESFIQIRFDSKGREISFFYVRALFLDSKNYLWIGSWENGYEVYNLNANVFTEYLYLKNKEFLIINNFFEDDAANIWITTWDKYGVYRIENPHLPSQSRITIFYPQENEKSGFSPVVYAVNQDKNGNIILATANGLQIISKPFKYESQVQLNSSNSTKISSDEIFFLYKDRSDLIWYSIYGVGINALNSNRLQFNQYDISNISNGESLPISVTGVYEDSRGYIWLGIKSYVLGVIMPDDNKLLLYNQHPVLNRISHKANSVFCFYSPKLKPDELWIGTRYDGIYIVTFKNKSIHRVDKKEIPGVDPKNLSINQIVEDHQGRLWIATNKGLFCMVSNELNEYVVDQHIPTHDYFLNQSINSILIQQNQNIWIGTHNKGLYRILLDDESKQIFSYSLANNKLNNNEVLCLLQDHKFRIWCGTKGGGFCYYDNVSDSFNIIENMSLIPDDAVYSMQEDHWGNLWLATGNGLVNYNHDLPLDQRIRVFTGKEGVSISTFNPRSTFKNEQNELFFGGTNGIVSFIPEKWEQTSYVPRPVITGFMISNEPLESLAEDIRLKISNTQIPYTDKLYLSHHQRNISIEFSAMLYDNIAAVKYAYRMEGIDKEWVYVDARKRFINYNNLAAGTYNFKIKAANAQGVWSDVPTVLSIKVKPAPWKTVYAYLIYFLLVFLLTIFGVRFLMNRLRMKKMFALEHIEREKSEEVHQAKLRFFTNISHEFFTPITILKCAFESLAEKYPSESQVFYTIRANTERLVRLLEQVVDFRKVETGNMKLKLREIEIVSFIKELCDVHFSPLSKQQNISLTFETNVDEIRGYVDTDKLDKIIYNLLSNAFKYNYENGSVTVDLEADFKEDIKYLYLTVADTGFGMSDEVKRNLFKRFYEGNFRDFKVKSIGIGLSLIYDLIQLNKGQISVDSIEGKGTKFRVALPISKECFNENDFYKDSLVLEQVQNIERCKSHGKTLKEIISAVSDKKLNLLFVEDNPDLSEIVCDALAGGFAVLRACNGNEALEILSKNVVDIVVTDVVMPEMDGIELTTMMKSLVEYSHIPVIMLSAQQNVEHKVEGYDAGADSYITKPFELPALVANINSLIRNRRCLAESFGSENGFSNLSKYAHNNTDREFLEKVKTFIEENVLEKDFTTNDLYEKMNMSQSTFYRKLHSLIGISPNEFIRKIKIEVACRLLVENQMNVSEVAYDLGFSDPKYFSGIFKKETGISPSEFIKQKKQHVQS